MDLMMSTPKALLILGNGFDIAHGLPTKYTDFLDFVVKFEAISNNLFDPNEYCKEYLNSWNITHEKIKEMLRHICKAKYNGNKWSDHIYLFEKCLKENLWKKYFISVRAENSKLGNNWIDFEGEIKYIIKFIDEPDIDINDDFLALSDKLAKSTDKRIKVFFNYVKIIYDIHKLSNELYTVKDFRDKLFTDLENFALAFEIYIVYFIEAIRKGDLKAAMPQIAKIRPEYIISFNYTKTYEKLYDVLGCNICHVHGLADEKHISDEECNLVLGISEYLKNSQQDIQTDYVRFKKYSQRIMKNTDKSCLYWFDKNGLVNSTGVYDIKLNDEYISDIWIYGHSLDTTDKDILSVFMKIPKAVLHIFIRKLNDRQEAFEKLIKIVGRNYCIDKDTNKELDFVLIDPDYAG